MRFQKVNLMQGWQPKNRNKNRQGKHEKKEMKTDRVKAKNRNKNRQRKERIKNFWHRIHINAKNTYKKYLYTQNIP
jgi:hypothetical protein